MISSEPGAGATDLGAEPVRIGRDAGRAVVRRGVAVVLLNDAGRGGR